MDFRSPSLMAMELCQQQNWSRFPFPSPGNLPDPRIEFESLAVPALAGRFFTTERPGKSHQFSSITQLCPTLRDLMD